MTECPRHTVFFGQSNPLTRHFAFVCFARVLYHSILYISKKDRHSPITTFCHHYRINLIQIDPLYLKKENKIRPTTRVV